MALRCAGFRNDDIKKAYELGITVVRIPACSPRAVAEHSVALMFTLNRRIHRAYASVQEGTFALDGLPGFDTRGKTVGIIGTRKTGERAARVVRGFGCRRVGYHP